MSDATYLLGTQDDEFVRLGQQHAVWALDTRAHWDRAGFRPGQSLLDLGCGPGFASVDLAHLVGDQGRVLAVDRSARFMEHLANLRQAHQLPWLEGREADVESLELPDASLDGAYVRWVLCFLPDVVPLLGRLARWLRPGAALAIHDYYHYPGFHLAPTAPIFGRVREALIESWDRSGGSLDVGSRLPDALVSAGFELEDLRPVVRMARPGDATWGWLDAFLRGFVPQLSSQGLLSHEEVAEFLTLWEARSHDPGAFVLTPPQASIVARVAPA